MRLFRAISSVLMVIFIVSITCATTVIRGRILNGDGKPMKLAHVFLYDPNDLKVLKTVRAGNGGQFSLQINRSGIWMLHATGVGFKEKWITLYIQKEKNVQMDIYLEGYRYLYNFDRAAIIGDFNNWYPLSSVPMKLLQDSILSADVTCIADTLAYRLMYVRDGDDIEGVQADRYIYHQKKGYMSILDTKKGKKVKITLDVKKLPKVVPPSKIIFAQPDAIIPKCALIVDTLQHLQEVAMNALLDYRKSYGTTTQFIFRWDPYISQMEHQMNDEKNSTVRQTLCMSYLTMSILAKRGDGAIYKKVLDEIPPTSIIWVLKPHNLFFTLMHSGIPVAQQEKYVDQVIEHNPSQSVKIAILFDMYMASKLGDQKEKAAKYFNLLAKRYGKTEEGKKIISSYPLQ